MSSTTNNPGNNRDGLKAALRGVAAGAAPALLLCLLLGLSPLAAADREALALAAVSISLPLGAAVAWPARGTRQAGNVALAALAAGGTLALLLAFGDPTLLLRLGIWCAAAALLGAAVASMARNQWLGVATAALWLFLCGLPFFCDRMGPLSSRMEDWALQGCPWLGFAQDALDTDPLRRPVMYLGKWSPLSDSPAGELLTAGTLWVAAALAFAALVVRAGLPRPEPQP